MEKNPKILLPTEKVLIAADEYRELRKKADALNTLMGRVDAFCDYVNSQKYDIDREVCGAILGFDVKEKKA